MPTGCPVCEELLDPTATSCGSCGFPTALSLDALKALSEPVPDASANAAALATSPPSAREPDPQSELCDRLAREIDRELGTLADLGGDPLAAASELRQAALSQADGRVVEALGILQGASQRLLDQIDGLFETRLVHVEGRAGRLKSAGIGVPVDAAARRIREALQGGDRATALRELVQLDERLSHLEGDFSGLQGLLREIETLRVALAGYAPPPAEVEEDVSRIRTLLATPELTPAVLDEAGQLAARAAVRLQEQLPPHLEEELTRHGVTLERYPPDHPAASSARGMHADALRHLRRGRLAEATQRLAELRQTLEVLQREEQAAKAAAPPPTLAPPAAPPAKAEEAEAPAGPDDEALKGLLAKARGLAARVRRLPPDSEVAFEAASAIRRATELLRARKLEEADLTLSRLMQTLSAESVGAA